MPPPSTPPEPLLKAWLAEEAPPGASLRIFRERAGSRKAIVPRIARLVVEHYVATETILKFGGYSKAAELIRNSLPENKKTRSGDLGEVLATEYVESEMNFQVPIRKLRWKSDREMPMHGNDVIAINTTKKPIQILKGECKSAQSFGNSQIAEAVETLDDHGGRPNPSTIAFIIKRLYELSRDQEAAIFKRLLCSTGVKPTQITHHIFALCGNNPSTMLLTTPAPKRRGITRLATAVLVAQHATFVSSVFEAAHG